MSNVLTMPHAEREPTDAWFLVVNGHLAYDNDRIIEDTLRHSWQASYETRRGNYRQKVATQAVNIFRQSTFSSKDDGGCDLMWRHDGYLDIVEFKSGKGNTFSDASYRQFCSDLEHRANGLRGRVVQKKRVKAGKGHEIAKEHRLWTDPSVCNETGDRVRTVLLWLSGEPNTQVHDPDTHPNLILFGRDAWAYLTGEPDMYPRVLAMEMAASEPYPDVRAWVTRKARELAHKHKDLDLQAEILRRHAGDLVPKVDVRRTPPPGLLSPGVEVEVDEDTFPFAPDGPYIFECRIENIESQVFDGPVEVRTLKHALCRLRLPDGFHWELPIHAVRATKR